MSQVSKSFLNLIKNTKLNFVLKIKNVNQLDYILNNYKFDKFDLEIIPDIKNVKNLSESQQKEKEGELILGKLTPTDQLILLDEKGENFSSVGFSEYLQKKMNSGAKTLVFVIGGPYGFSQDVSP